MAKTPPLICLSILKFNVMTPENFNLYHTTRCMHRCGFAVGVLILILLYFNVSPMLASGGSHRFVSHKVSRALFLKKVLWDPSTELFLKGLVGSLRVLWDPSTVLFLKNLAPCGTVEFDLKLQIFVV